MPSSNDESPLAVLDPAVVEEMFRLPGRSGPSLLAEIVRLYLREEPPRIEELHRQAAAGDHAGMAQTAHKLAGGCAVIGARQLQGAAIRLEYNLKNGAIDRVPGLLGEIDAAWGRLKAEFVLRGLSPAS